ncbi:MAG: cell division protein ZapA [Bacteroidales bacterium]|nr:cell division protein ZapA [Bacteroidales bacterium]
MAQNIKLKIAGIEYPMVATSPEMEETMRTAADEINRKFNSYDAKYPDKSVLDKLIIVTLNETVNRIACQKKMIQLGAEAKTLKEDIDAYLAGKE